VSAQTEPGRQKGLKFARGIILQERNEKSVKESRMISCGQRERMMIYHGIIMFLSQTSIFIPQISGKETHLSCGPFRVGGSMVQAQGWGWEKSVQEQKLTLIA
jgi:hypothetical protein